MNDEQLKARMRQAFADMVDEARRRKDAESTAPQSGAFQSAYFYAAPDPYAGSWGDSEVTHKWSHVGGHDDVLGQGWRETQLRGFDENEERRRAWHDMNEVERAAYFELTKGGRNLHE